MSTGLRKRACDLLLVVGFGSAIWLPLVERKLRFDPTPASGENRELSDEPPLPSSPAELEEYPSRFEAYWNDRFGLRRFWLRWNSLVACRWLGASPAGTYGVPRELLPPSLASATRVKVLVGDEDWLYFAGDWNSILADWRGVIPFSERDLTAFRIGLQERRDALAARGIDYLFTVVPDKGTVYPEHLPAALSPASSTHRVDQLIEDLRARSTVEFVDLRPVLAQAKARERVYETSGSHWNDLGAHAAYAALMDRLAELLPAERDALAPAPIEAFERRVSTTKGEDLARMLRLDDVYTETAVGLVPLVDRVAVPGGDPFPFDVLFPGFAEPRVTLRPDGRGPRLLVLRDSFFQRLIPFFAEHFSRAGIYFPRNPAGDLPLTEELLQHERPDVVLDEWVERDLVDHFPVSTGALCRHGAPLRFEQVGLPVGAEVRPSPAAGLSLRVPDLPAGEALSVRVRWEAVEGGDVILRRRRGADVVVCDSAPCPRGAADVVLEDREARPGDAWELSGPAAIPAGDVEVRSFPARYVDDGTQRRPSRSALLRRRALLLQRGEEG